MPTYPTMPAHWSLSSAQTINFHYGKHLKGYVDTLNKLIVGTEMEGKSIEQLSRLLRMVPYLIMQDKY